MTTYKFLGAGRRAPFGGAVAPPSGVWFSVGHGAADGPDGVRAYIVDDLAHWLGDELWEIELDRPVTELPHSLVASRARLVRRIEAWNGDVARRVVEAWVWRGRDALVQRLRAADRTEEAGVLAAATSMGELAGVTAELECRAGADCGPAIGAVRDAAEDAIEEPPATALQTATVALVGWSESGHAEERRLQSNWIAAQLGLRR